MAQKRGPDGTVRVAINGHIKSEPWTNVVWAQLAGGATATQAALDSWLSSFANTWATNITLNLNTDVQQTDCQATLFQPGETALHSSNAVTHDGGDPNPLIENLATCKVLSWRTSVYWRGGKPRTYLPGVGQASTDDGQTLNAAAVSFWQNAGNTVHTAINALSATGITQTQHGFVSFMTGGADRVPSVFFPISNCVVHPRLGTQRGRLGSWRA